MLSYLHIAGCRYFNMGNSQGSIRFKITFDGPKNGKPVFYSGQTVSGFVTLDLEKPMSMRGKHFLKTSHFSIIFYSDSVSLVSTDIWIFVEN